MADATHANPLLESATLPRFDAIRAEHVVPAITQLIREQRALVAQLEAIANPTFATVVEPLEELQHALGRAWSPVGHLNAVMNSETLRAAYNECLALLSDYHTDLSQSEKLYRAYAYIAEHEGTRLDPVQRQVIEHALRDFRLSGVALDPVRKERFKTIMMELSRLSAKFEENVLDATNAWSHHVTDPAQLKGINQSIIDQARQRAQDKGLDGHLFGLDQPTYVAVVTDGESESLRRVFYEAWSTRAAGNTGGFDNSAVMEDILRLRHEAAKLLDFDSFADYALANRMARSVPEVTSFLNDLVASAKTAGADEFAELEKFAGRRLNAWDVTFYSERLQQRLFSVSQEELREYLPLPRVLQGLFDVAERLFDVRIREREGVAVWHPDARYYEVQNPQGAAIAAFYLDPYARPHKRSGAWMDDCIGRKALSGTTTLPVAYLVCNSLPPAGNKPAQLTHDDVVTLFHEFGHGLHHMLTRVNYPSLAGINGVAWDAVELPSQFMENYAWQGEVLDRISAHEQSGAPIPADRQRQLIATRSFQAGLQTLRQVEFALFDMRLHSEYDPAKGGRIYQILSEVRSRVAVVPIPDWNRYPHSFGHIFAGGYAAGYYSYKWAEVLAADAFAAFAEAGAFDHATARRFLDSILSRGGSCDALDAFVEFRGRKPEVAALLKQYGIAA
ncbi:MAG TPA: M3 family metallopeptidase [Steroidobacteraceae bacterium]|jgi:oligopeptidase A|nr:M3 family metallopeptidase [Steroidobacteraceae bacterium]